MGASAELLRRIDHGQVPLLLSIALALEYEATCRLAEHRLAAGLDLADTTVFLDGVIDMAERVTSRFRWRPQLNDPGDEMVLEPAVNFAHRRGMQHRTATLSVCGLKPAERSLASHPRQRAPAHEIDGDRGEDRGEGVNVRLEFLAGIC